MGTYAENIHAEEHEKSHGKMGTTNGGEDQKHSTEMFLQENQLCGEKGELMKRKTPQFMNNHSRKKDITRSVLSHNTVPVLEAYSENPLSKTTTEQITA